MCFDKRPSLNASPYTKQHNFKVLNLHVVCQLMEAFFCSSFRDRLLTISEGAWLKNSGGGGGS